MTDQKLWQQIMNYDTFDRMPVLHWGTWDETLVRWYDEGLPKNINIYDYLGASPYFVSVGNVNNSLYPRFEKEIIEEDDNYISYIDHDGVTRRSSKKQSSIPQDIEYRFKTANDWPEYKKKLLPNDNRVKLTNEWVKIYEKYKCPVRLCVGSLMGELRNWMGVENMVFMIHDDPDVFGEYVQTAAELACWIIDKVAEEVDVKIDTVQCWEDICGSTGPFISPDIFEKYVSPGYLKIRNKIDEKGIKFFAVDCDGLIEPLIKPWLESGVNILYPVEIGTWNADPLEMRKKYGKELRLIGGYNKLEIEKTKNHIDTELKRRIPLAKDGGYVLMPDHFITPDTSLDNYKYYLDKVRQMKL